MRGVSNQRLEIKNGDSHVSQSGTEVLVDVCFQDGVEVLEFDVANQCDYKYLVINKRRKENQSFVQVERTYTDCKPVVPDLFLLVTP